MGDTFQDDGNRDGTLAFTLTSNKDQAFNLSTIADVLSNFDKLLTAIDRDVSGRKKNRAEWSVIACTLTDKGDGSQEFLIRVRGYFPLAAQCEQKFVDLCRMLEQDRAAKAKAGEK